MYTYYGKVVGDVAALAAGVSPPRGPEYYALLAAGLIAIIASTTMITRAARRAMEPIQELTDAARARLGRVGYDPAYGARPLKRAVQRYLQDPLADEILAGRVHDGSVVKVDAGDGGLVIVPG